MSESNYDVEQYGELKLLNGEAWPSNAKFNYCYHEEDDMHQVSISVEHQGNVHEIVSGLGPTVELAVADLNGKLPDTFQIKVTLPL